MRIHHLNFATYNQILFGMLTTGSIFKRGLGVTHCLLIETGQGLLLVDTGFGTRDYTDPSLPVRAFTWVSGTPLDLEETALRQVARLGYDPAEVKHIALTHCHLDHAGGLPDFPHAQVHLYEKEHQAITHPRTIEEQYVCRKEHWAHDPNWVPHALQGDTWFGFDCTPPVKLGETEFFFVPLVGHSRGHSAVVIRTPDGWLMHCGDAYIYHGDVHPEKPFYPRGYRLVLGLMGVTKAFRSIGDHAPRLRALLRDHRGQVRIFCSHDIFEFKALQEGR